MLKPCSDDLRARVASSVAVGRNCRETAVLFGVNVAGVVKWSQRQRTVGSAAARRMGRPSGRALDAQGDWLMERAGCGAPVSLGSLAAELAERGVRAAPVSIWRVLRAAGFSLRKTLFASEQDRPAIARRRAQWRKDQGRLVPRRLVFVDETWAKTNLTALHGWGPRGHRLIAKALHGTWRPSPSWPPCAPIALTRPAASTARASRLERSSASRPHSRPAMSW
jgi:transposase